MKQPEFTFEELQLLHSLLNAEMENGKSNMLVESTIDKVETSMMTV